VSMPNALKVYRKEMREALRDKRVILTSLVSPFAAVIVAFAGFALLASDIQEASQTGTQPPRHAKVGGPERVRVGLVGPSAPVFLDLVREQVAADSTAQLTYYRFTERPEAECAMAAGQCDVVLVLSGNPDEDLYLERTAQATVITKSGSPNSVRASRVIMNALGSVDSLVVGRRLQAHGVSPEAARAVAIGLESLEAAPTSAPAEPSVLALFLPYLLVLATFFGGVPTAFDAVAGEKERGTLETALVSPVGRGDLVWGKFLAVLTACIMAGVSALAGVVLASNSGIPPLRPVIGSSFSWSPVFLSLGVMVPLGVFFSAMLLIVSSYARNQREAQTYLMPLSLAVMLPAMYSIFGGFGELPDGLVAALVPVYNCTALVRMQIEGGTPLEFVALALGSCSVYAVVGVAVAERIFRRESVLLRM